MAAFRSSWRLFSRQKAQEQEIIGIVSLGGLRMMCKALGFSCEFLNWDSAAFKNHAHIRDYLKNAPGQRQRYPAVLRPM